MSELQFPLKNDTSRKIIHIDMDAFFASVEERDDPELAKHPLVIARHPSDTGGRGRGHDSELSGATIWHPFGNERTKSLRALSASDF